MRSLRVAAGIVVAVAALYGLGRLFARDLVTGAPGATTEPVGVRFAAPPGYVVVRRGELDRASAARALARVLATRTETRLALRFTSAGSELYWLVDRADVAHPTLTELAAAPSGTRIATTWRHRAGELDRRLAWAAAHGTLAAPGLPAGEAHNLYH